jgi:hypothetical protein
VPEKNNKTIGISKVTEKERVVLQYKATGEPMRKFEYLVGKKAGISKGYANNLFQKLKKKSGMNSAQLQIWAMVSKI